MDGAVPSGNRETSAEARHWLLDQGDPGVRYRFLREILARPAGDLEVAAVRKPIGRSEWAARILAEQLPSSVWASRGVSADELYRPKYTATNWRLLVLADLGMTSRSPAIERAVRLPLEADDRPDGKLGGTGSEACFTGNAVRMLATFGYADHPMVARSITWLVDHPKADGGWHCFESEVGTLDCWEPLAGFAALPATSFSPAVERAIGGGSNSTSIGGSFARATPRTRPGNDSTTRRTTTTTSWSASTPSPDWGSVRTLGWGLRSTCSRRNVVPTVGGRWTLSTPTSVAMPSIRSQRHSIRSDLKSPDFPAVGSP